MKSYLGCILFAVFVTTCKSTSSSEIKNAVSLSSTSFNIGEILAAAHGAGHPRVMFKKGLTTLKEKAKEPHLQSTINYLKTRAEALLKKDSSGQLVEPLLDYNTGSGLTRARTYLERVHTLGMAFLITGNKAYSERLWLDTAIIADQNKFPDWGDPKHELDIAEMAHGAGLAYDWFFTTWDGSRRGALKQAIMNQAIRPAIAFYKDQPKWFTIPVKPSNWNFVVNGGLIVAAMSVARDAETKHPGVVAEFLGLALPSLARGVEAYFGDDGSTQEGPGYWIYAMEYLCAALESLITASGSDHGFLAQPGFRKTGYFALDVQSNTGNPFNYADSQGLGRASVFQFLGHRTQSPLLTWYGRGEKLQRPTAAAYYIIYYKDAGNGAELAKLPKMTHYPNAEVVMMRSNWTDVNSMWAGFKGGDNQGAHAHLDLGSFVFQANAYPWIVDPGIGNYSLPGYFLYRNNYYSKAWDYYRLRVEGQNAFILNPKEGPEQWILAKANVHLFDPVKQHGGVQLLEAYNKWAGRAERGFAFIENDKGFMVRDHIASAKEPLDYYWMAHTRVKKGRFLDGSQRSLVLEAVNGKRLLVFVREENLKFQAAPDGSPLNAAVPLPSSPNPPGQKSNAEFRKLILRGSTSDWLQSTVVFYPLNEGDKEVVPKITDPRFSKDMRNW